MQFTTRENHEIIHQSLENFVEKIGRKDVLGAVMICDGKVMSATISWWERLKTREVMFISILSKAFPPAYTRDVPIYLPYFVIGSNPAGTVTQS
jgi:hypothetical protein